MQAMRVLPRQLLRVVPSFLEVNVPIIGFSVAWTDGGSVTRCASPFLSYAFLAPLVAGTY